MSGRFEWAANHAQEPPHVRTTWHLDDGNRLLLCDARKFGRIICAPDLAAVTANLGVEPLGRGFTAARLAKELHKRGRQLKPLLLDQSVIAGLGNIYADESLFRAGLHPTTRSNRLDDRQVAALREAIRAVLREAIRYRGTSFDWIYPSGQMQGRLLVYGRTGEPCPRCNTPIERLRVAQRGTHICPRCQPRDGRP
jgi:formamidopyrimidine-DNA glycosylase